MNPDIPVSQASATPQENLRAVIAANITNLRKNSGMTQQDLAVRLNYTDKAISKWERGESVPDIVILKQIADIFGITVDYLLREEHEILQESVNHSDETENAENRHTVRTRGFVTGMSILLVWLAAVMMFIVFDTMSANPLFHWFVFACAVCASLILWLVMNSIWFNRRRNYLIISLLMWSFLILLYMSVWLLTDRMLWLVFILGIPGQAIIVMWSNLKQRDIR
ncbi:MAG: helix-turn-helix transcriptional regulator [Clostridia bacterium]|nr:helix-turn-helix transcriptional regulator [Clostridia bacterium]